MREEVRSSGGTVDPLPVARSSSPPLTPAASSAGASSPAVPVNIGSNDWLGNGQGSKAGSLSCIGSHPPWNSLSTSAGGSNLGSSQPSCRPWERGDLLRRLSTFKPSNWFGKPKVSSSLACARRGWVNVDADKIECESCGARFSFTVSASLKPSEVDDASENFAKQLDTGHKLSCPWRGNSCAESLAQFPPTPPTALVGGYKDRCDGLLQFLSLPVVTASAIDQMRISRGPEIDRFLSQLQSFTAGDLDFKAESIAGAESAREEALCEYSHAQRLISLCGWEPRWLANVQDYEEHSAQSARDGCSFGPTIQPSQDPGPSNRGISASSKKDTGKKKLSLLESQCESRSPLLDCSLCGATVRILDFITLPRPARFSPGNIETPETSKKMALTRGVSAASGVNGWVAADGVEKEQTEGRDEAATTDEGKSLFNVGMNLNLTMGGGLPSTQLGIASFPELQVADIGRDLMIGQPSSSEVGDRAASYESRGPSTRKRRLEEGGSTVDRPHIRMQRADSIEGTVIDRDGDEVDDIQYSAGPSKRACDLDIREMYQSSHANCLSGAGPSNSMGFDIDADANRIDALHRVNDYVICPTSTKDSARASSVVAMDTICHTANENSMESVENYPGDDDVLSPSIYRNPDMNDTSELNYSNQAQQSACFQPAVERVGGEMGVSNTTDGEEILNTETVTVHARNGFSFGISGGSVGMGASHEAEIHGTDVSVHRPDSVAGDADPIAEVTENQGQSGESPTDPGLMGEFVPGEMEREDPHGDSQELMSQSVGRADSSSKIDGSAKAESVESGERISQSHILAQETSAHPSLSCNAVVNFGYEASKEEVTRAGKASLVDECTYPVLEYVGANEIGPPNGESYYEEAVEFDPIKHHNSFCPWVNGNVAAAGCSSDDSSTIVGGIALCGWQLTLDALDSFQSLGHVPVQIGQSESAASLYKDDHRTPGQKLVARRSVSKGHGHR